MDAHQLCFAIMDAKEGSPAESKIGLAGMIYATVRRPANDYACRTAVIAYIGNPVTSSDLNVRRIDLRLEVAPLGGIWLISIRNKRLEGLGLPELQPRLNF